MTTTANAQIEAITRDAKFHGKLYYIDPEEAENFSHVSPWNVRTELHTMPVIELLAATWDCYGNTSTYELANGRWLQDNFPDDILESVHGRVYVALTENTPSELLDIVEGLSDYAIIDEDTWSQVEYEQEQECWEMYGRDDLLAELEKVMSDDDLADVDRSKLDSIAFDVMSDHNIYREFDACAAYYPGLYDRATLQAIADRLTEGA